MLDETSKAGRSYRLVNYPIPSFAVTHPAGPFPASPPFRR